MLRKSIEVAAALIAAACVLAALPAAAQSGISGFVRDTSGAVLPGVPVEVASPDQYQSAFTAISRGRANALITLGDFVLTARRDRDWPGAKEPGEQAGARARRRPPAPAIHDGWPAS